MSQFTIASENLNKFVSTFDETVNKVQGTPYLDQLFKNLKNAKISNLDEAEVEAEAVAKETKEAKADHNIEEEEKKT